MTAPNISHQSGHARAYIEHTPFNMTNKLFVMHEDHTVTLSNGQLILKQLTDGLAYGEEYALLSWDDMTEDYIIDIFRAIGKALEIYSDEPSQAFKQGFAEGQSSVLREWNESLRA